MAELTKIGGITIDIQAIKQDLWNVVELTKEKCLINFKGKTDLVTGEVINRAPLILDCPIAELMELIEKSEPVAPPDNIMVVTKDKWRK